MVLIPRHNATAVIDWLDREVAPNQPYRVPDSERTEHSRKNPYYVSTTAQIAEWRGEDDLWRVRQSARNRRIEVTCRDPRLETIIALRWGE